MELGLNGQPSGAAQAGHALFPYISPAAKSRPAAAAIGVRKCAPAILLPLQLCAGPRHAAQAGGGFQGARAGGEYGSYCCFGSPFALWHSCTTAVGAHALHAAVAACSKAIMFLAQAYAMTEASHQMTSNPLPKHGDHRPGTVGKTQGSVQVSRQLVLRLAPRRRQLTRESGGVCRELCLFCIR